MKIFWQYLKKYKKLLWLALGLAAVNQFFSLLEPQLFRVLVDRYIIKIGAIEKAVFLVGVAWVILGRVGVAMVSRIAKNFQDYFVNVIAEKLGAKMYADSVGHSFSLPFAVFEDQRSGELLQKLQKARDDSKRFLASAVNVGFFLVVGIIFVVIYSWSVHWLIGLAYFLTAPLLLGTFVAISARIKKAQKQIVSESAGLAGATTETLRNVELVKSLGLESQEINRLNSVNDKILSLELKKVKLVRTLSFIQGTLINAIRSAILFLIVWYTYLGIVTFGEFYALYIYSFFVFSPLGELGEVATQYQEARASLEKLEEVLRAHPKPEKREGGRIGQLESVLFDSASFQYRSSAKSALHDISFIVNSGETIAFVGPSGAGKSTIIKLLAGLYQPASGAIKFNGQDSRNLDIDDLRQRFGLVAQETQLFAGTVRENLLFVRPRAADAQCLEVLQAASALPILERGAQGLNTKIGEGGLKLSGGERQRLAIARALLRQPELLIFDEATSSLDSITEKAITETIKQIENYRPGLMTVLVAHRLSTVAHAHRIYVLEKGRIIEQGRHAELLKSGGLYAALWREQVGTGNGNTIVTQ